MEIWRQVFTDMSLGRKVVTCWWISQVSSTDDLVVRASGGVAL